MDAWSKWIFPDSFTREVMVEVHDCCFVALKKLLCTSILKHLALHPTMNFLAFTFMVFKVLKIVYHSLQSNLKNWVHRIRMKIDQGFYRLQLLAGFFVVDILRFLNPISLVILFNFANLTKKTLAFDYPTPNFSVLKECQIHLKGWDAFLLDN